MKHEPKKNQTQEKQDIKGRIMDNPEVMKTEKESLFDMHDDMKTVDAIPVEELNQKMDDESKHRKTKNTSSSEQRFPG